MIAVLEIIRCAAAVALVVVLAMYVAYSEKGIEPVKKMDYDGRQYTSVQPIREDKDDNERGV